MKTTFEDKVINFISWGILLLIIVVTFSACTGPISEQVKEEKTEAVEVEEEYEVKEYTFELENSNITVDFKLVDEQETGFEVIEVTVDNKEENNYEFFMIGKRIAQEYISYFETKETYKIIIDLETDPEFAIVINNPDIPMTEQEKVNLLDNLKNQ